MGINNALEVGWTLAVGRVPEKSPSFYPFWPGPWGPIPGKRLQPHSMRMLSSPPHLPWSLDSLCVG